MRTMVVMDVEAALAELSQPLATALRLRRAGLGGDVIAVALGIEEASVAHLLDTAQQKLDRLTENVASTSPPLRGEP